MINILRHFDKGPPPYSDCVVVLVDALRDFIRADEMERRELFLQGSITEAQAKNGGDVVDHATKLLTEIERWGVNGDLDGLLRKENRR